MTIAPLSDTEYQRRIEALNSSATIREAADACGLAYEAMKSFAKRAARKGQLGYKPTLPGYEIAETKTQLDSEGRIKLQSITQRPEKPTDPFQMPDGFNIARLSTNVDGAGRINQQWVIAKPGERDPVELANKIKEIFNELTFEVPYVQEPETTDTDCLSFFPVPDLHMGLYCWGKEVGGENWHLDKADIVYRKAFSDLVGMTPANDTAIILFGGDQIHSDSSNNKTPNSGHSLDVDGRYERVIHVTCEMAVHMIAQALQKHERVIVRVLKGNHDPHASTALAFFLHATFKNNERVTIDVSPDLYWTFKWGSVMLAATHGHTVKANKLPGIMAARWPEMWGQTQHRFGHSFHIHHREKYLDEDGGAVVETHQSPAPQDNYNYGAGFLSGRSLRSIVYHKKFGEHGGSVRPIIAEDV